MSPPSLLLRDKDYVRTRDDLIFNIIGYDHADDLFAANLKYLGHQKWTAGYAPALRYLQRHFPQYVAQHVVVPRGTITQTYHPQHRLKQLIGTAEKTPLQQVAVELVGICARELDIPRDAFGITDSLLWGLGTATSDVDLVVYSRAAARRVLDRAALLYRSSDFSRLEPASFSRGATRLSQRAIRLRCQRWTHKGLYRGTRFSIRAVRNWEEWPPLGAYRRVGPVQVEGEIVSAADALFFPATYAMADGTQVVCYETSYEGLFRAGDIVRVAGEMESGPERRIVVGTLARQSESIELLHGPANT